MGKIEKNKDGTHTIKGGFSSADPKDRALLKPLLEKNLKEKGIVFKPAKKKN